MATPDATQPLERHYASAAAIDVFDRVIDYQSTGKTPPQLGPAVEAAQQLAELDAGPELDQAYQEIAHAAIANIARIRARDGGSSWPLRPPPRAR